MQPYQTCQYPVAMHRRMPVEAPEKRRVQLSWWQDVAIGLQDVGDLVGILAMYASERQRGEAA